MASLRLLAFLFFVVILLSQTTAQPDFVFKYCFDGFGKYDANSTYQTNLNALLSKLTSNTQIDYGFYNLTYGQDSDEVYATGLCRGDIKPDDCRRCLNNSRVLLPQQCKYQIQAIGVYDECMLHYSDTSIFGPQPNLEFSFSLFNETNAKDWGQYNKVLTGLLEKLRPRAAAGDSRRKFAAGNATGPSSQTIYGLVQCQPDLTEPECKDCLERAILAMPYCNYKMGCTIIKPSCNFRYENYRFYAPTAEAEAQPTPASPPQEPPPPAPPSPQSTRTTSSGAKSNNSRTISTVVVPIVAFVVVLLIFICIYLRVRKPNKYFRGETEAENEMKTVESLQFNFDTIGAATNNFSDTNKLGQGGFGPVYKGRLSDGQEIAVKRLSRNSEQGDNEFKNEVLLMAKLMHRNLVRLLGFCLEKRERLLVYEFLPNKSLDYFIFDPIKRAHLEWETRYKIIVSIARGLLYLHEESQQRIIHRNLKASNILLDEEMNPKISDFGMARLFIDQTQANTNKIVGTYGYMAPEYALYGKFSAKSDVFSFGVLILEIISGQKNNGTRNGEIVEHLPSYAWKNWKRGTASNIVDPTLNDASRYEIMRCIHIGLLCVQKIAADTPTLASVVLMLSSNSLCLPVPSQPAFFMDNRSSSDIQSCEYSRMATRSCEEISNSNQVSVNETSITEPYPR